MHLPIVNNAVPPSNSPERMRPSTLYCFSTQLLLLSAWLACAFLLARPIDVRAADDIAGRPQKPQALQETLRQERSKGPIFVAIPVAYTYGIGGYESSYCSPSIRATNSSNAVIEELIIGIDYFTGAGKPAGATVTRYSDIKVRRQDTHYFYQLAVSDCRGLAGKLTVVRCVYSTGDDCSAAVQAIDFGSIPLRLKSR